MQVIHAFPDDETSTSALLLRLNLLEDLLSLPSTSIPTDPASTDTHDQSYETTSTPPRPGQDVISRTEALERRLGDVIRDSGHESLRRFVDRFEAIQNFLTSHAHLAPPQPPNPTFDPTSTPIPRTIPTKTSQAHPTKISLPLVLSAREDLLGLPSQIEAIRGLVERGVDGSGGLSAYFSTGSGDGDGVKGSENQGIGNEERPGQAGGRNYDVTSRLNAVETALYGRLAGRHMDDGSNPVDLGTSSVVNVSSATTTTSTTPTMMDAGQGEAGGVSRGRGENLRRVGEVLGRWDNFIKDSSQIFLNLHQTMTDLERAVERAERVRGFKV